MSHDDSRYPSSLAIWMWLVALLALGLLLMASPFGKGITVVLIFAVAGVKAFLVAKHYMHLRSESLLIYMIGGAPVLLLVAMLLALVPDIIFNR